MTSQSPIPNTQYPPSPQSPISNLRIAIWAAVSSKPQAAEDKTSLQDQEASGRQFAAALEGHVVHVYTIPGHTRDLIFWSDAETSMPAYRQLREDCQAGTFDVLWARDPDRLGRDPALSNQVISLVEKSGAEIYLASAPHPIGQTSTGHRYIYAIQTVRAGEDQTRRIQHHNRRAKSTGSPLAGVAWCARCHHQMTRVRNRTTYYLRCSTHARQSTTGTPCHSNRIKETAVIAALTDHLQHLATDPTALDQALATPDTTDHHSDLIHVDRRLADLDTRRNRLALALAAGHLDPQMYKKTDDVLKEDVVKLQQQRQQLQQQIAAAPDPQARRQAILTLAPDLPDLLTQAPPAQVRTLLQNAGLRIQCETGAITSITLTP